MFSTLVVEDNPGDARIIERLISDHEVTVVEDLTGALAELTERTFDVILLDLSLPDSIGPGTLARVNSVSVTTPAIVLTGRDDPELGAELIRSGAQDYIPKSELNEVLLRRVIQHAIERKRIVSDLVAARDHMRQFTHHVAHDLKGPLARIGGFARLLGEDVTTGRATDITELTGHVDAIERQVGRMDQLIEKLMQLARSGYADFRSEPVVLNDIVDRAATSVFANTPTRPHIEREELPSVRGDQDWLFSLFANLFQNAADHAGDGATVHVRHVADDDMVRVKIVDDGIGIATEDLPEVFQPFKQLRSTQNGHGLGLALCRNIVERHGGVMTAEPGDRGIGVAFVFTLPGIAS